ncbi:MAG: methylenetetrahydrofolate reductase [Actinobacteria bacterium]|nr:methylenetetrahydrofolate reductase [Actinomycetota bacterium]
MTERAARSGLHRLLRAGEFVVTAELATIDSADPAAVGRAAATLRGSVDAVNCTDNSAAHTHLSPLAAARLVLEEGIEPILQLACRDRNRLALQADLLGAAALGVRNVVCMTGDDVTAGDHPEAKPLFDIDAVHLLRIARIMRDEGMYLSGRPLSDPPEYLIGAVENPFAPPLDFRPMRLGTKIEAGAEFIQTQICFNLDKLRLFMARCGELGLLEHVWILAGVFVPASAGSVRYLRDQVPGVDVPPTVIERMEAVGAEAQREEGIRLALDLIQQVRDIPGIAGIHLMTINNEDAIPRVVEAAGLLPRPLTSGRATPGAGAD